MFSYLQLRPRASSYEPCWLEWPGWWDLSTLLNPCKKFRVFIWEGGLGFRLNLSLYQWSLIAQFSAWCSLSTCSNLEPRSPMARRQWDLVQFNLKHMRSSSKARKYYTGLAATGHVRPDCRDCVVILPTVILESECTGNDRILITFFEQFAGLEVKKTLLLCGFLQFSQDSRARATTAADVNVAHEDKNYARYFKKKRTRSNSLIT